MAVAGNDPGSLGEILGVVIEAPQEQGIAVGRKGSAYQQVRLAASGFPAVE